MYISCSPSSPSYSSSLSSSSLSLSSSSHPPPPPPPAPPPRCPPLPDHHHHHYHHHHHHCPRHRYRCLHHHPPLGRPCFPLTLGFNRRATMAMLPVSLRSTFPIRCHLHFIRMTLMSSYPVNLRWFMLNVGDLLGQTLRWVKHRILVRSVYKVTAREVLLIICS